MKLIDFKEGQKLIAIDWYANCIRKGDKFVVEKDSDNGELFIRCQHGKGHHALDNAFVTDTNDVPELQLDI